MEWKKLRRKIQVPAYIQFFISIVFWIAAGLGLYGTLPLAVYVFMGMLLVCNISIILSTFLLDKFYIVNLQENFKNLEHLNLKLRAQRHEYLNEMQEGELFQTKFERTDNFVIDSILSYKLQEADRLGIETKMDVKVPKDLNVSAYVLTGILTNLLDNAMEACEKVKDKKIKITIKYAKKMLIIRISNTYDGKEKFNSVMGIKTSKKDKELHGYGIKSIRHMVESVDGDFEIHTKEEWFVADVVIPLV